MPDREKPQPVIELIKRLISPEKIPGWTGLLCLVLLQIAGWKGGVRPILPGARNCRGGGCASSRVPLLASGFCISDCPKWSVSRDGVSRRHFTERKARLCNHRLVSTRGFTIPFCSLFLIGHFVTSSRIPEIVRYIERETKQRTITPEQERKLYGALRHIADKIILT
jgi:hypothetical protein